MRKWILRNKTINYAERIMLNAERIKQKAESIKQSAFSIQR
ncbi:hypothetical protein SAMN04488505_111210 [Chitinophaga rupis]|uniref:Uncharacterized protein n=1 Tax=Chitinophaga rupis TaxID=573321 RepID=A0A1H8HZQ9_9BACT|nr:hypothetical protein SAMN04488505_111210 [Chitinophaga rupis]